MTLNQLFTKKPDMEIMDKILESFNLENLQDTKTFTKKNLIEFDTVNKLKEIYPVLNEYYLPCKSRKYLGNLNYKNCITILRQFIKIFGYFVFSKERYIKGEKYITYQLAPTDKKNILKLKKKDEKYIVSFD